MTTIKNTASSVANYLPKMAKSLLAGAVAFVGSVAVAAVDNDIVVGEWWAAAATGLAALGGVWGVSNKSGD